MSTVLLIALVTSGAILLGLLAICLGMTCFRHPGRDQKTGDRRAMIPGTGGDSSSEGSVTDLAIPHHVPHILPPPPQMIAPLPPNKRPVRKISAKPRQPPRKATMVAAAGMTILHFSFVKFRTIFYNDMRGIHYIFDLKMFKK